MTKQEQLQEIKQNLIKLLEESNNKVFTICHHVTASGMSRRISAYITQPDGEITCIDWYIDKLGLYKQSSKGGLAVNGCGMDMGFNLVYNLSSHLFRNEDGSYSHDGAYKLKQRWL